VTCANGSGRDSTQPFIEVDLNLLLLGFFFFRVDMMMELFLGQNLAVGIETHFNAFQCHKIYSKLM